MKGGGHGRGDRYRLREDAVSKVVVLNDGDGICEFVVLNELDGDRNLDKRQEGDSAEAVLMRRALTAPPMTITRAEP